MTVNPHRITVALDRAKLFGPTADTKLGAVEPDLDNWEAGRSQPTERQLAKLAQLANVPAEFFHLADHEQPQLIIARVCGRRTGSTVISMRGEPAAVPRPALFELPEECHGYEVDGQPVVVRGDHPLDAKGEAALVELVRGVHAMHTTEEWDELGRRQAAAMERARERIPSLRRLQDRGGR